MQKTTKRNVPRSILTDLVSQAQEDPSTFGTLYNQFIEPIYRYLYSSLRNRQDAEDLAAQTFLSALLALPKYRDRNHFSAWLFSIARNKAMDHFRRAKREIDVEIPDHLTDHSNVQEQVSRSLDVQHLSTLIQGLRSNEQELIRLRYVADLTFAEMAAVLGKKEDTVKKALYRLLAQLESQMEVENE